MTVARYPRLHKLGVARRKDYRTLPLPRRWVEEGKKGLPSILLPDISAAVRMRISERIRFPDNRVAEDMMVRSSHHHNTHLRYCNQRNHLPDGLRRLPIQR